MTEFELNHVDVRDRRARILTQLRMLGFLSINELARDLRVSPMTVRRTCARWSRAGRCGSCTEAPASPRAHCATEPSRPTDWGLARDRVASAAVRPVGPTDTIAIDAGPTGYALARALPASFAGSVITHSMPVLQLLAERPGAARLVALGGELRIDRHAFVGPSTEAALAGLRARTFFLEPSAMDARGLYSDSVSEARVQRRLMDIADDVVLLATADVASRSAPALIAPLDHLTKLVVDAPVPRELATAMRRAGVTVQEHVVAPSYAK